MEQGGNRTLRVEKSQRKFDPLLELTIAIFLPCFRFHRVYRRNIFLFLNVLSRYSYFYPFQSNQSNGQKDEYERKMLRLIENIG